MRVLKLGNGQGNKAALVASLAARVAMPVAMSSLPSVRPSSAVPRHRISLSHCQPLGRLCLSLSLNLGRLPTPQQWFLRSHCHWHVVDRVGARRVALDQRRKYLRTRGPRTGRETDESAHGWARCRSISGAVTRCVGAMYVYILIYTAGTDQIERNES